jgi:hypothetical protein
MAARRLLQLDESFVAEADRFPIAIAPTLRIALRLCSVTDS